MAPASEPAVVANRKMVRQTALYGCSKFNNFRFADHPLPRLRCPSRGCPSFFRLPALLRISGCKKGGVRTGKRVRASESRDRQPLRVRTGHAPSRGTRLSRHSSRGTVQLSPGTNWPIGMFPSFFRLPSGCYPRHSRKVSRVFIKLQNPEGLYGC